MNIIVNYIQTPTIKAAAYQRSAVRYKSELKSDLLIQIMSFVAGAGIVFVFTLLVQLNDVINMEGKVRLPWVSGGIAVVLGSYFTLTWAYRRASRKKAVLWPNEDFAASLSIDELGYRTSSKYGESFVTWAAVSGIEEDAGYLFLMMRNGSCIAVPKKAFESETQVEQVFNSMKFKVSCTL